jgi:hypothetical protein
MEDKLRELKQASANAIDAEVIRDRLSELQTLNGETKSQVFSLLEAATDTTSSAGSGSGGKGKASQCYEWCVTHPFQLLGIVSRRVYLLLCSPVTWRIPSVTIMLSLSPFRAFMQSQSTFSEIPYSLFYLWASRFDYSRLEHFCTIVSPADRSITCGQIAQTFNGGATIETIAVTRGIPTVPTGNAIPVTPATASLDVPTSGEGQCDPETDRQLLLGNGDHRSTFVLVHRQCVDSFSTSEIHTSFFLSPDVFPSAVSPQISFRHSRHASRDAIAELTKAGAAAFDVSIPLPNAPTNKGNVGKLTRQWNGETPVLFHPSALLNPTSRLARQRKKEKIRIEIRAKYRALDGVLDPQPPPPCALPKFGSGVSPEPVTSPSITPPFLAVRNKLSFWESVLKAPPRVLAHIRDGVSFRFVDDHEPPPIHLPPYQLPSDQNRWMYDYVQGLITNGRISKPLLSKPHCVLPIFCVPKGDSFRLVYDATAFNAFVVQDRYTMEDIHYVLALLREGDLGCSIDVEDAYHILGVHPEFTKFFGFPLVHPDTGHITYHTWFVNCFGFINAGGYFNATLAPLIKHWRQQGFRVTYFGDDILGLTPGVLGTIGSQQLLHAILHDTTQAGLTVKQPKIYSALDDFTHIGYRIFTAPPMRLGIKTARRVKARAKLAAICQSKVVTPRQASSAASSLISMLPVLGSTCFLRTRALYSFVASHVICDVGWNKQYPLPDACRAECMFWISVLDDTDSAVGPTRYINRLPQRRIVINAGDASATGIGVVVLSCPEPLIIPTASTSLTLPERLRSSLLREMKMILFCMSTYRHLHQHRRVITCTDATGARQVSRYGSSDPELQEIALAIDDITRADDTDHHVLWWPRDGLQATHADELSHECEGDICDFILNPQVYDEICSAIGWRPTHDLYADHTNHKAPIFFSRTLVPKSAGVNAIDQQLPFNSFAYACPPPTRAHIAEFLHATCYDCTYLLILPAWINTPQFPLLFSGINQPRPGVRMFPPISASVFTRGPIGTPSYIEGSSTHYTKFWVLELRRFGAQRVPPQRL